MISHSSSPKFVLSKKGSFTVYIEPLAECFVSIVFWVFYNDILLNHIQDAAVAAGVDAASFSTFNSIWNAFPAFLVLATVIRIISLGARRESFAVTQ